MKRNLLVLITSLCIIAFCGLFLDIQTYAGTGDLYYFNGESLYFDLNSMKQLNSNGGETDIRFGFAGSYCYFLGLNGSSIQDMGSVSYEAAKVPYAGYSADRVKVQQDHVYAVRCGNGAYGIIKVTSYSSEEETAEFTARLAETDKKLKLHYLNGDVFKFDLETMKGVQGSQGSDIYFRYMRNVIAGENGASIKDLGMVDYESAKAPATGYSAGDIAVTKDHVYAVRVGSKGSYVIKVTNAISESEIEFVARTAETGLDSSAVQGSNPTPAAQQTTAGSTVTPTAPGTGNTGMVQTSKEDLYWVENETRFVMAGNLVFEDAEGILYPFLSPNKKFVVYTQGSSDLWMYDIAAKTTRKIYELEGLETQVNYQIHPIGWSQDGKQVAYMTSYRGGFIGGNQLCILNLSDKKVSVVAKGLSSADWGKNGMFAIANGTEVWLVDQLGRNKVTLSVPTARAFFGADNVSFNTDCTKVIYIVGGRYYLHDIKANTYAALSIPEAAASNGTVRARADGRIAVIEHRKIYIYDPPNNDYRLLYEGADSAYPNWLDTISQGMKVDLLAIPFQGSAYLSWEVKNLGDIDGYYVYRAKEPGKYTVPLTSQPIFKREFIDEKPEAGVSYYYIVRPALQGNKLGESSNEVSVTIK